MKYYNVFLIVFPSLLLSSCKSFSDYYGAKKQVSLSRDEAIKNNFFIKAYKPINKKIVLPNSDVIDIQDAWIERVWHFDKRKPQVMDSNLYQVVILTGEKDLVNMFEHWTIGIDDNWYFTGMNGVLISNELNKVPTDDTLSWKIQKGYMLTENAKHEIIGELVLVGE